MSTKVSVTIQPATPDLAATLTRVACESKGYWGYPLRWMARWRPLLTITPQFIAGHPVFVAMADGGIVGFYALAIDGSRGTLEHLWVVPQAIGRGVGRALFEHAVGELAAKGVTALEITADPNAEGFYLCMGARRAGTKRYLLEGQDRLLPVLAADIAAP